MDRNIVTRICDIQIYEHAKIKSRRTIYFNCFFLLSVTLVNLIPMITTFFSLSTFCSCSPWICPNKDRFVVIFLYVLTFLNIRFRLVTFISESNSKKHEYKTNSHYISTGSCIHSGYGLHDFRFSCFFGRITSGLIILWMNVEMVFDMYVKTNKNNNNN